MAAGATAAAAAAAAEAARRRQEEESMTEYSDGELRGGWEFKILRANTKAFKDPDVLRKVCEEEARAGWVLLEKFDDSRLRFKRPLSARDKDGALSFDPYRTQYGIGEGSIAALIIVAVLVGIALILVLVALLR
ncbi:MAG: hypothetical protein ACRD68_02320 [Pyrinomonadaceae bacterium]